MAKDDDVIYVDVVPQLDEDATEKVGKKASEKLKSGVKGTGKEIGRVLQSEIADELDSQSGQIDEAAKKIGSTFGKNVQKYFEDDADLSGPFKRLKDAVNDKSLTDGLDVVAGGLNSIGASGASEALDKISDSLKKQIPYLSDANDHLKSFTGLFNGFDENASGMEGALGRIGGKLGELSAVAQALEAIYQLVNDPEVSDMLHNAPIIGDNSNLDNLLFKGPGDVGKWLHDHLGLPTIPTDPALQKPGSMFGPEVKTDIYGRKVAKGADGYDHLVDDNNNFVTPPPAPSVPITSPLQGPAVQPGYAATPSRPDPSEILAPKDTAGSGGAGPVTTRSSFTGGGSHRATLVDFTTPSTPTASSPKDVPGAGSRIANLYRVAEALQGTPYSQALRNDCSGMVSELAAAAVGMPLPSAGERFSTSNEGQWLGSHGFKVDSGPAPQDSLQIGWYDHGGGNSGHTAATLPGGINAESGGSGGGFRLGGAVGANSPQFEHHAFLPIGAGSAMPAGYGIGPGMPTPGPTPGGGLPFYPGIVSPPTPPNVGGPIPTGPKQQVPFGSGPGGGVSGGGLIGLAEQGIVGAATAAGFMGAGGPLAGMAAQAGTQIANQAISTGVQAASILASAPLQTFGLQGGQFGAPTVQLGGWAGKILGGLVGQQTNLPNIAGATTAPKKPDDKSDPLNGNMPPPGTPSGPSGAKDDPIHIRSSEDRPQPPQGAMTDHMTSGAGSLPGLQL